MNLFVQENRTALAARKGKRPPDGIACARTRASERQSLSAVSDINQAKARRNLLSSDLPSLRHWRHRASARRGQCRALAERQKQEAVLADWPACRPPKQGI